jgi:hypothetical protein
MWARLKSNHHSVTAPAANLVSAVALLVAWGRSRVMRALQYRALVPVVKLGQILPNDENDVSFDFILRNWGIGLRMSMPLKPRGGECDP